MVKVGKLLECEGFDWDKGNIEKNWLRHKVSPVESEQIFFNEPLIILDDPKHTISEKRFAAFGCTDAGRFACSDIHKARKAAKSHFCKRYESQRKEIL